MISIESIFIHAFARGINSNYASRRRESGERVPQPGEQAFREQYMSTLTRTGYSGVEISEVRA